MSANANFKPKLLAIGGICTLLFFSYPFMLMQNLHFHHSWRSILENVWNIFRAFAALCLFAEMRSHLKEQQAADLISNNSNERDR